MRVALPTLLVLAACGDDPAPPPAVATKTADYVSIDAQKVCRIFTTDCSRKTGQTLEACVAIYTATRVPPACIPKLDALTCDTPQAELEACWPSCTGTDVECDGPNLIQCATNGRRFAYTCDGMCATQGKTWAGVCGRSYKTQTAERATCWCN